MHIRMVGCGDGPLLKRMTLRSVEDAPYAFGGVETLEEERLRADAEWESLAAECAGEVEAWRDRCAGYFVMEGEVACGKGLVFLSPKNPLHAYMTGVWIEPGSRGRGLGRMLVEEAVRWAVAKGADRVRLMVDDGNAGAVGFYLALGFVATGTSRPVREGAVERESLLEMVFSGRGS